jgi:hypothetical protein
MNEECSGDTFTLTYQDGRNYGAVEVVGTSVEKDRYKIWRFVRELAVAKIVIEHAKDAQPTSARPDSISQMQGSMGRVSLFDLS